MHEKAGSQRAAATGLRKTQRQVPGSRFGLESDALSRRSRSLECRVSSAESVVLKDSYGSKPADYIAEQSRHLDRYSPWPIGRNFADGGTISQSANCAAPHRSVVMQVKFDV